MLHRSWAAPLVIAFWLVTNGWLVTAKILPTLLPGSPPGYQSLYVPGRAIHPVAWSVHWNDMPVGWALMEATRGDDGGMDVANRLQLQRLPLGDVLPEWAGNLLSGVLPRQDLGLEASGNLAIDAAGLLERFSSVVSVPGVGERITLDGEVNDGVARVTVRAGGFVYETSRQLPKNAMIGDELSPQATMSGLAEGRHWTVPIYSPLRPVKSPIDVLHAAVGPEETIFWEDGLVRVHVVEYREDPSSPREPRCRIWVDRAGRVLKQESALLRSHLTFVRRTDEAAARLAADMRVADARAAEVTSREAAAP
jgi:hypothetical protein